MFIMSWGADAFMKLKGNIVFFFGFLFLTYITSTLGLQLLLLICLNGNQTMMQIIVLKPSIKFK